MRMHFKSIAICLAIALSGAGAIGQVESIKDWAVVPTDQAGFVVVAPDAKSLVIGDDKAKPWVTVQWPETRQFPLVTQIRLKPGPYQIRLKAPLDSVGVVLDAETLTYLRIGTYKGQFGEQASYVAVWSGPPTEEIESALRIAAEKKGSTSVYATPFINTGSSGVLTLSTEPPWPIPPPPKR